MIRKLVIKNFRCYVDSTITFNGTSILVGKNNAGKSTMIEALKIVSSVTRKYRTLRFTAPPSWLSKVETYGVSPNVENMNISDRGIFNMYGNPPAIIEAVFSNGTAVKAYVGEGLSIFAVLYDEGGCPIHSSKEAKFVNIPLIEVLPQISAVLDTEKAIKKTTVDGNRSTRLASRNFRNQLFYYSEAFPAFKDLVESTWEELRVNPIESYFADDGRILQFFVRVRDFEAEIGWMGHGLQMWVQTMWFISQCPREAIVVLDEPDVYMHADLQRRLIRIITPMFKQLIVATHSLEIIEEVPSDCIIPIDSHKKQIRPMGDESALHSLSEELGSPLNIDLARIFISNRFIVWDGDESDRTILSVFQSVLYPQDLHPIITLPKSYVSGWDGWEKALTVKDVFSLNGLRVQLYYIFNSGYHTLEQINKRQDDARKRKMNLHIWKRNEIDNYAINTNVICRYLEATSLDKRVLRQTVVDKVFEIIKTMKDEVFSSIASGLNNDNRINPMGALDETDLRLDEPFDIISGKRFFGLLSEWTNESFGVSISARQVIPYFHSSEVPPEVKNVIDSIMQGGSF